MTTPTDGADPLRLMLAYLCIATEKEASLDRKVEILDRFGLSNQEMAIVCGCAVQSVKNARNSVKKQAAAKGKKNK